MIVVNDKLRCAGVIIPKVASSSIRSCLAGRHVDAIPAGYFTFAFIRHPWDRLVSALYTVFRSQAPADERLAQFLANPGMPIDSHARPQADYLAGQRIDFLGRYERLAEDWRGLQRIVGELPDLPHFNAGKYRPERWQDAPITWARWRPLYEQDFALCPDWQ